MKTAATVATSAAFMALALMALCAVNVGFATAPEDTWVSKASTLDKIGRFPDRAAVLDGKIYAVTTAANLDVYNPTSDTWTHKTSVPNVTGEGLGGLYSYTVAACNGKIHVIGSESNSSGIISPIHKVYDPATDRWENKSTLNEVYLDMQSNVVDGKIYIIGGSTSGGYGVIYIFDKNYVYDPANDSWSVVTPVPEAVSFYSSAVLDDKIYIIGGTHDYEYPNSFTYLNIVQIYDPKTDSWSQGTPAPELLSSGAACSTTGYMAPKRIYMVGGENHSDHNHPVINGTFIYDPETGAWSTGAPMPTARYGLSLVNIDDILYALGGAYNGTTWLTANEAYTPPGYGSVATPSPGATPSPVLSPSPSIPEFPSWIIFSVLTLGVAAACTIAYRKKRRT